MNDTHANETEDTVGDPNPATDAVDAIAAMDPADAPGAAERLAAELAEDLEEAGASAPDPVQLRADLGDGSAS